MAILATLAINTPSFASESFSQILANAQSKEKTVEQIRARISQHEKLSLSEIKQELSAGLEKNRKAAMDSNKMSPALDHFLQMELDLIQGADDKDLLISQEKLELQNLVSSGNYMFFFSQVLLNYYDALTPATKYSLIPASHFLLIATGAIDIATLLFTFIASACTGF